jgi:Arc/MetJ-type ribon-helix-helix transcriptional regulator
MAPRCREGRPATYPAPICQSLGAASPPLSHDVLRCGRAVASGITFRHTGRMTKAISVRLDHEAQRALRVLEATGLSQSEAIRSALLASAGRLRKQSELASEVAALEADDFDRAEMLSIAAMMESMRSSG